MIESHINKENIKTKELYHKTAVYLSTYNLNTVISCYKNYLHLLKQSNLL